MYGTLLLDDVVKALIDRVPRYDEATALGWQVMRLPRRVYPGLVPGDGKASGKVFTDLTDTEWEILDAFEDPAYTLTPLRVMTLLETDALAYTWQGEHTDQLWVSTEFGHHDLADYLNRCRTWRRHYAAKQLIPAPLIVS
ncbi:MAG: gamma-glutamylcyclotransferase family protein [Pseudonocardiaceae bacterium]